MEHQGEVYEGEHEAIIEETIWFQVQQLMENSARCRGNNIRNRHGALLRGLVVCGSCQKSMNHTYTKKGNILYRYYVCETAQKQGYKLCPAKSLSAKSIENFVVGKIRKIGSDRAILKETVRKLISDQKNLIIAMKNEGEYLRKELVMLRRQVKSANHQNQGGIFPNDRENGLNDRIKQCEKRLSEINRQKILLSNTKLKEKELKAVLSIFDPVWDVLFTNEQVNAINLSADHCNKYLQKQLFMCYYWSCWSIDCHFLLKGDRHDG